MAGQHPTLTRVSTGGLGRAVASPGRAGGMPSGVSGRSSAGRHDGDNRSLETDVLRTFGCGHGRFKATSLLLAHMIRSGPSVGLRENWLRRPAKPARLR